jgi:hypothetical protein
MNNLGKFILGQEFLEVATNAITRAVTQADKMGMPKAHLPMPQISNAENKDAKCPNEQDKRS